MTSKTLPTIKSINLDDEGIPRTVVVKMTIQQLAEITVILGKLAPATGGTDGTSAFYECATSELFNLYWDDGINDFFRDRRRGAV